MKSLRVVCALSIALSFASAAKATTVTISQPNTSTVTSPVTVSATVNTSVRIMQLYIDGQKTYQQNGSALSTSIKLPVGSHRVAVQSVDSHNNIVKTVKYVTVSETTPPPPPPPPPPPAGTTLTNLQESTSWQTCGNCGNGGGTGKVATYDMARGITSPALDNQSTSAEFSIGGPYPYTNAYWYMHNTAPKTQLAKLVYDFYIYVPEASASAPQAIEFECQHTVNHYTHNFAWQADYPTKSWRTFDYTNRKWVSTPVAFAGFTPNTWHHIIAEYHEDGANTVHDAITVDGVRTVVNIVRPGTYSSQTWASFTNAFQLDLNKVPTAFSVYVDKMNVHYE